MLLGVYLHGAMAYAEPAQSIWLATDGQGSRALDISIWWIHLFRMSLFFWLAGYFSKLLIGQRGELGFLRSRAIRIALPFVLFYPILLVLMTVVIVFAISYVDEPAGLLGLIVEVGRNTPDASRSQSWSTMHLWFLYYLAIFTVMAVVLRRVVPIRMNRLFRCSPWFLLWPLGLVPAVMGGGVPVAAPESFVPAWWSIWFYGWFFWFGWQTYGEEAELDRWQAWLGPLLGASVLLFIPYYIYLPNFDVRVLLGETEPIEGSRLLMESALTAYLSVVLTILALLVGKRFLSHSSGWLRMTADSSYWIYLIHLPIVIFMQTLLIPWDASLWVKLVIVIGVAWLFSFASYLVFVRYTPVGWMLHGPRQFP